MSDERIAERLMQVRASICAIEHILGPLEVEGGDVKEFDKAIVIIKAGAKIMKRELSRRGFKKLGKLAKARVQ